MGPIPGGPPDDGILELAFGVSISSAIAATLIPAVAGKRISVHAFFMSQNTSGSFNLVDLASNGNTVAIITGTNSAGFDLNSGQPFILPYSQYPLFTCAVGDALGYWWTGGGTIFVAGRATYVQA